MAIQKKCSLRWIKYVGGLTDNAKVRMMARKLGVDRWKLAGHFMQWMDWMDLNSRFGEIIITAEEVDEVAALPGFCAALESVGWIRPDLYGELEMPEFCEHNGTSAKLRAEGAQRQEKSRSNRSAKNQEEDACLDGVTEFCDQRRGEENLPPSIPPGFSGKGGARRPPAAPGAAPAPAGCCSGRLRGAAGTEPDGSPSATAASPSYADGSHRSDAGGEADAVASLPPPPVSAQVASPLVAYAAPGAAGGEVGGMDVPYGFEQFVFDVRSVRSVWSVPDFGSAVGRLSRAERRAADDAWRSVGPEFYQHRMMVEQFMAARTAEDEKGGRFFRPDSLKTMFREIRGVLVQADRWWKEKQKYRKYHG